LTGGRTVTVFGGTGFLGRRIVWHLLAHEFSVRVATRHPERARSVFREQSGAVDAIEADVNDDRSVRAALEGAFGAVNAVSLYVEHGRQTFHSVHVEGAARVARHAAAASVARLVHVSGIGADVTSRSRYIRSRGEGEQAVRAAFASAVIIRPAVMFGPDDAFLQPLARMLRIWPVFPLFGRGETRLQPAYVEDVGEAIARILSAADPAPLYEAGGPEIHSFAGLLRTVARAIGRRPLLVPVPFAAWWTLGSVAEWWPKPPLTRNQVELMMIDSAVSPGCPGLGSLGIQPSGIEAVLRRTGVGADRNWS